MTAPLEHVATCPPGLAPLLADELRGLGALAVEAEAQSVTFRGHRRVTHRVHLESGLASHVLVRVGQVEVGRLADLRARVAELPWESFLRAGKRRRARVQARSSRLFHSGAVEERVLEGIADRLADGRREPAAQGIPVRVNIVGSRVELLLDTTPEPLHRRAYRLETAKAPLREDLALALSIASSWDPDTPLLDPFCGAGTVAIEAARRARRIAPGKHRKPSLARTALFHRPTWDEAREKAEERERPAPAPILAVDRDEGATKATRGNAERAGVLDDLTVWTKTIEELDPTPLRGHSAGAIVTNPPYGKRVGHTKALNHLHATLVRLAKGLGDDWRLGLILPRGRRPAPLRGLRSVLATLHGGMPVRMLASPTSDDPV